MCQLVIKSEIDFFFGLVNLEIYHKHHLQTKGEAKVSPIFLPKTFYITQVVCNLSHRLT